jgi:hypothetical protein
VVGEDICQEVDFNWREYKGTWGNAPPHANKRRMGYKHEFPSHPSNPRRKRKRTFRRETGEGVLAVDVYGADAFVAGTAEGEGRLELVFHFDEGVGGLPRLRKGVELERADRPVGGGGLEMGICRGSSGLRSSG